MLTFFIFNAFCVNIVDAGYGGSIEPARIDSKRPLDAGGEYDLPLIKVTNNGEEEATFHMSVIAIKEQHAPSSWFAFTPGLFRLGPGENQEVGVTLKVPAGASPGDYYAGIQAASGSLQDNDGFNVALVSILQFTVGAKKPNLLMCSLVLVFAAILFLLWRLFTTRG
ncbi:MAG TPA: NEW3 domain-containing protein [Clostridia bacterium]|nr:NEW3 domain-containing protein [Clostridia bacterium]